MKSNDAADVVCEGRVRNQIIILALDFFCFFPNSFFHFLLIFNINIIAARVWADYVQITKKLLPIGSLLSNKS